MQHDTNIMERTMSGLRTTNKKTREEVDALYCRVHRRHVPEKGGDRVRQQQFVEEMERRVLMRLHSRQHLLNRIKKDVMYEKVTRGTEASQLAGEVY